MNAETLILFLSTCGAQIEVPLSSLRKPFLNQDLSSTDFLPVALLCPFCKHIERQGMESFLRAQVVYNPHLAEWYSSDVPLRCDVEACKSALPLVHSWTVSTTEETRKADRETWKWDRLRCQNGHVIRKPKDW
jgi:hypothetical protein